MTKRRREIVRRLGHKPPQEPFNEKLTPPGEWESMWRRPIPNHQTHYGSDDYVEFTWHCPTVWIQVYVPSVSVPGVRLPAWTRYSLCGMRGVIDKSIYTAGKAISGTMMDLVTSPDRLKTCKDEWKEKTSKYMEKPLLPPDMEPPVDLPWPEYITTQRGREWHIPPFKV